jgi:hypothetical protein
MMNAKSESAGRPSASVTIPRASTLALQFVAQLKEAVHEQPVSHLAAQLVSVWLITTLNRSGARCGTRESEVVSQRRQQWPG